jgi:hypothetical protein
VIAAAASENVPGARTSATPAALDAKLTVLQGVGPGHAASLARLGMQTLGDMLYYYPRRYDDYSELKPIKNLFYGEQVTVIGTVQTVHTPAHSRRQGIDRRDDHQRWDRRPAPYPSSTSHGWRTVISRAMRSPSRARSTNILAGLS